MKKSTLGALLLLLVLGIAIGAVALLQPKLRQKIQIKTSDSKASIVMRGAGDNYLGYWFITCPMMRKTLLQKGERIDWTDDGANYAERLRKFANKEYDFIVLPVNSYLLHGKQDLTGKVHYDYPGVILAAVSESKGADGIVGFASKFPQGKVSELNDASLRGVYTADSPSSFLIDLTMTDFDLYNLQGSNSWRNEVAGSPKALEALKKGDGDFFVLWDPDLTEALDDPAVKYIWGSDKFAGYIVDVFVFRRDYYEKHEPDIVKFFQAYFQVMSTYANNQDQLAEDIAASIHKKKDLVKKMLANIDWYDLAENCDREFGISLRPEIPASEGVINTILACTDVLVRTKKFPSDPLKGDPYLITNKGILEKLVKGMPAVPRPQTAPASFAFMSDGEWTKLREVGTIRVEPITFQSWNNQLTTEGKDQVDKFASLLLHNYPDYRVAVRGNTESGGDERENVKLSLERAQAVVQRLTAVWGIDANRVHAEGMGSSSTPVKKPGESPRAYRYRLSRVEFVLLEGGRL